MFVAPALFFSILFDWVPMFDGIRFSFYDWRGFGTARFVGLDNFREIIRDNIFWVSIRNMLFFLAAGLVLMIPQIICCVVLFRIKNEKTQYFFRVLICLPMVVPGIVGLLMWQFMYNPQFGLINNFLELIGRPEWRQAWLGDPRLVKWCLVFMGFPFVSATVALIYLGGLKSIPETVWEAGMLDGVGPVRRMISLELPLLIGQIKLNLIGVITGAVVSFGNQLILTRGGPGFASMVPGLHMYNAAFVSHRYGYASAIALVLFMLCGVIILATFKFIKSEGY